ncbi:XRE family transcriptional regulator [Tropicimonas sp. IMCC6043]|nr:XRE family transcriptional regulator [Tropicimonas sp. IMCC6043]
MPAAPISLLERPQVRQQAARGLSLSLDMTSCKHIHMCMNDRDVFKARLEIGARLRTRRKELGLTQCEVAAFLGHKGSCRINQIELGRQRLYAEELPRLCRKLECCFADIVGPGYCPDDQSTN